MSILKNQKHEMEYDTSTKQAIFSKRNKTSDGFEFPERIFKDAGTHEESAYKHTLDYTMFPEVGHYYDLDGTDLGTTQPQTYPYVYTSTTMSYKIIDLICNSYTDKGRNSICIYSEAGNMHPTLTTGEVEILDSRKDKTLSSEYFEAAYFELTLDTQEAKGGKLYYTLKGE